jgi:hypothetical protein
MNGKPIKKNINSNVIGVNNVTNNLVTNNIPTNINNFN